MVDAKIQDEIPAGGPPNEGPVGTVDSIGVHPVKSLAGLHPDAWWFDPWGPALDRRWMLTDETGRFLSLRELPALALLRPSLLGARAKSAGTGPMTEDRLPRIRLELGTDSIEFEPTRRPDTTHARLWKADRVIVDEGDEMATWLSQRLDRPVRLVRHRPDLDPWQQPEPEAQGASTGLADGYPVLVVAARTIADAVGPTVSDRRFRANIVVGGVPAAAEDVWTRIRIGAVELELVKPCVRCVATTVDPDLGTRDGAEPLATLSRTRRWNGKPVLGWNALIRRPGVVSVGDEVTILETRSISPVEHQNHQVS
ncbi:MAG: MOSC domain-containing protein [Phycisphaera sp.]|nr:MOSC domain-containing protein [Phycisphaera sp.]